jgi:hypothetical protein
MKKFMKDNGFLDKNKVKERCYMKMVPFTREIG